MSIILCDLDGVVCGLHAEWLRRYNADFGDSLTLADITTWDMVPHVKPECGRRIYEYLHARDLYDRIEPIAGAIDGVRRLRAAGHRVVFVTSCVDGPMAMSKIAWLSRFDVFTSMADVVIAHDKSLVRGDLMIDDYPKNLDDFDGPAILFDAPYNRASEHVRAVGWDRVVELVEAWRPKP